MTTQTQTTKAADATQSAYSDFSRVHTLERGCVLYNRFTSPSAMRTDAEHARCRKAARRVRSFLFRIGGVAESESGRLYPL